MLHKNDLDAGSELARVNRALEMLSSSNQALIRADDEEELLGEVCCIAVQVGGYPLAWVGLSRDDEKTTLVPAAQADLGGRLDASELAGGGGDGELGPVEAALMTGATQVHRGLGEGPALSGHDELLLTRGYRSATALPLVAGGKPLGVLSVYSHNPDAFEAGELRILEELSGDLAFGLTALRTRREREHAVRELRDKNRQLRTILDGIPDFLVRFDAEGRFCFVSGSTVRGLGLDQAQILGKRPAELAMCDDPASARELGASIARVLATGEPEQLEVNFALPGGPRPFEVRHLPERDDGGVVAVLGIARDLTSQRAAARQLYLLNYALDNIADAVYLMSGDSPAFRYVNRSAALSLGYSREELTSGMGVCDIDPSVDDAIWKELVNTMRHQRHARMETTHRTRDGRVFPIEVTGNYFEFDGELHNMAIVRDMSERRAAEASQRALEDQLRQSQKMEAIGQLAGGVAHDFNNVLAVIQLASSMLLEELSTSANMREGLHEIQAAAERAANLTRQLLVFSRRQVADPVDLDWAENVRGTLKLLHRLLSEQIALDATLDSELPLVYGDPGMLEQVLMNLAINARDAMPHGGQLGVRLEAVRGAKPAQGRAPSGTSALHVCLTVSDSGSGIAPENLPRIFEPFFTTKELGKGTGLGLATVLRIVELHRGWISVESERGRGSTFRVFLPAITDSLATRPVSARQSTVLEGTETILLVEDDASVREMTSAALKRYGYRIIEAESAAIALQVSAARCAEIDLLLTDLVMPGDVSGRQLAELLVARSARLKVLFTSGYSPELVNFLLRLQKGQLFLQKPYSAPELARNVRRCLDAAPDSTQHRTK